MRILHLTTFLQGGAGLAITRLASAQRSAGHDVTMITSRTAAPGYGNYAQHLASLAAAGVPYHEVDSLFSREASANDAVRRFLLHRMGVDGPPAVVHAHAAVPARIGMDAMALAGADAPVLQSMHGWGIAKSAEQARADVQVMNDVSLVVVPSRSAARQMTRLGVDEGRLRVVPYGVDTVPAASLPEPAAALLGQQGTDGRPIPVVSCIGTIGARKNQALLVDALALLPASARPVCLFIGDGDADGLRAHAAARGIDPWVWCLGQRADARLIARHTAWLVLPSRNEGLPLSVLEAFADHLPVIVSDIPELAELVDDGATGLRFRSESAASLAAALRRALAMPARTRQTITEAAWQRYSAQHQADAMVLGYGRAYDDVLAGRGPACAA